MKNLKKWLSAVLALSLVAAVPATTVLAEGETTEAPTSGTCGDNVAWVLDETGTLTISGSGEMTDYLGHTTPWWPDVNNLKTQIVNIVIEEGVTSIGSQAFWVCPNLTKVTIPNSVTSIGENTFRDCSSLTEINLPSGVTSIGKKAFMDCSSLAKVTIPNSVTSIEYKAFDSCTSLKEVTIPDSVKSIGYKAFSDCKGLKTICFQGDAPEFSEYIEYGYGSTHEAYTEAYRGNVFDNVTATAYYPAGNPTWTEEVRQSFGGNITWKEVVPLAIQLEFTDTGYVIGSSGGATIKCSGALEDFVSVAVDGVVVDLSNYTLKKGSTILTFTSTFMDTLSKGEHKITMNYTYGSIDMALKVTADGTNGSAALTKSPKTGDGSPIFLFLAVALLAGGCLLGIKARHRIQK